MYLSGTPEQQDTYIRELSAHPLMKETLLRMGSKSMILFGIRSLFQKGWEGLKFYRVNEVFQNIILGDARYHTMIANETVEDALNKRLLALKKPIHR